MTIHEQHAIRYEVRCGLRNNRSHDFIHAAVAANHGHRESVAATVDDELANPGTLPRPRRGDSGW